VKASSRFGACVKAHRFIRKMRGGAQAHLIEAVGGSSYVVKFTNNPQHSRILLNEWIASAVLRYLGVSTPDVAIVDVSPEFIRENPELHIQLGSGRAPAACGLHFGSRFGDDGARVAYDDLPAALLGSVVNLRDFFGVLVADKWLGNTDSRQSIFLRVPNVNRRLAFRVQMIDNGQAFDGGNWRFEDSGLRGVYHGQVYGHVRSVEDFEPWLTKVANFPEELICEALRRAPSSWCCGDTEAAFGEIVRQLMRRRACVRELIDACRLQPANPFPNWS
jgi:hypothetical protein